MDGSWATVVPAAAAASDALPRPTAAGSGGAAFGEFNGGAMSRGWHDFIEPNDANANFLQVNGI
jgi:hypothetical protein